MASQSAAVISPRRQRRRCATSGWHWLLAGASYAYIVKITTYVVNYTPEQRTVIGKARAPCFAGREPPASNRVGVAALAPPDWLVEIVDVGSMKWGWLIDGDQGKADQRIDNVWLRLERSNPWNVEDC